MTIDEAIEMYTSNAEYERTHGSLQGCLEFRQLAEWLKDYKRLKEKEPCEDVISRQAVLDLAYTIKTDDYSDNQLLDIVEIDDIKALSTVKPQERTGHWEWVQYDSNPNIGNWHCSECRTIIPHMPEETDNTPIYKWCPICGARMEVEQND